ncbi:glycosyltransferase [Mameliella alba]|uniref:glycosyltransferase n=1 Tax=Mameliella alba TaxID=561184 RepID=UPI000B531D5F|nr:glycosyltransferase [Mameliella alba]OWV39216.1 hypothetical protein CDZ95_27250 [Mameliella alba]
MRDILILTPWFPNQPDGWPARFISDSALALAELGHRVRVGVLRGYAPSTTSRLVAAEHRGTVAVDRFEGIESIRLRRYPTLPGGLLRGLTNRSLDAAVARIAKDFISERRPDVLLVHTEGLAPGVMPLVRREGLPVAVVLHGQNTNTAYLSAGGQAERFREALSAVDRLVIVGDPLRGYAERLAGRSDHVQTVWNGVHAPARMRARPQPDNAPVELISVANLQEGKGVDLLLSALARLRSDRADHWRLRIIGDGPQRDALQVQATDAGLSDRVQFLGVRTNAEVFDELAQADVFVLPSYREAFGLAYLEAMSTGLLTVGVEGEGPSQFIEHGATGLLVAPRSVESIVETLGPVLSEPRHKWRAIAAAGAEHVRTHCTWQAHAAKLTAMMERAIAGRAP